MKREQQEKAKLSTESQRAEKTEVICGSQRGEKTEAICGSQRDEKAELIRETQRDEKAELIRETQLDKKIEHTMKQEFGLPDPVKKAQERAFAQIREKAVQTSEMSGQNKAKTDRARGEVFMREIKPSAEDKNTRERVTGRDQRRKEKRKKISVFTKAVSGLAAAAAVFSGICITNPALASNIPLVGHVFQELGTSLGFSGDFGEYAKPLETETNTEGIVVNEKNAENTVKQDQTADSSVAADGSTAADGNVTADGSTAADGGTTAVDSSAAADENTVQTTAAQTSDSAYSKTVDGVTVTLSEVYCNDVALYLSMVIQSEKPLPDTMVDQFGKQTLDLNSAELTFSYNPDFPSIGDYLDGKLIDENTYAGVLRVNLDETNAFVSGEGTVDADSQQYVDIPDTFTLDLCIPKIVGHLPLDQVTTPEMPQEFRDAYDQALSEQGLDMKNYDNFTEDQQEIERQLFQEMYNKYDEKYPEAMQYPNHYENWWFDGAWEFSLDITKDHSKTVTKEVNLLDESGAGIVSVTRTPFEISLETVDPEIKYVCVALDADGNQLEAGNVGGSMNSVAIQDSDVDTLDLYVIDYYEYMDELKGWRLEENDVQAELGKTYKELLDERAVLHTEVKL